MAYFEQALRRSFLMAAISVLGAAQLSDAQTQIAASTQPALHANIEIHLDRPAKPMSPDLFGIFFEDLNYAADGGLYAELVQNRSFEYQATEQPTWNSLTAWTLTTHGDGKGTLAVQDAIPLNPNNPHYALLNVS